MSPDERSIRFHIALEMVERIYNDHCRDTSVSREESYDFCCFVRDMQSFAHKLEQKAKEAE